MPSVPGSWSTAHESFHIFECIPPWIDWQSKQRAGVDATESIRAGINFSIILASACFVEGNFERVLLKNINAAMPTTDPLQSRLLEDMRARVAKTTGSEGYNDIFQLVVGKKANELIGDPELWENIKTLFFFRNVIAHGRAVGYKLYFPPGVGGFWEEEFAGGYKKVEDFLLRKKLLESRHIEEGSNWHYFSDPAADFFWSAAATFVQKLNQLALPAP
ncbi:hypothetical protein [Achromobacter xylosoxidans]|uniref:hypothetical protein n=1 Tax=Alcaligenes xylosoxydans xylosoxydans TaxID=85698 RepID=UPI00047ED554|nr:hypothetical protein [Achromobacter xylosoxidans]